ncbi:L,D-transpeptidase (plasmid) [Martelella lutilitoris]|uniref:L,D-transpeptidase n=1 Tax=Martelella lutilitoris TaxID=2583532 RepID=A0A7T7HPH8_9HYPH|nr:L,D-transpeptidase [Martelella lutilitoris]QQM32924.1 L,D-transpeptidase [Martelella lutilitoris]QRX65128.1 L,D-transpeptidase [Dysgonomonadaceae bacterium zrk40]
MKFLAFRLFLVVVAAGLSACASTRDVPRPEKPKPVVYDARYDAVTDEPFIVPAVNMRQFDPEFRRRIVDDPTGEQPGTLVVDPEKRFLYLVMDDGKAMRYGVGVGRAGMDWSGTATVAYKREWPTWTPTQDMIRRDPETYQKWADGMDGGPMNPLGARALYLFEDGKDTLYRIHGTNEPWSIGKAMSSGCIRMMNQDVMDLYRRVPDGSKVVVLPTGEEKSVARNTTTQTRWRGLDSGA